MNTAIWVSGKRILLVEDDQAVRESIKLLLGIDRHAVTEAASGREALELFAGSRYDLVITDYLMPEMLGDELAQSLKNLAPAQPILMVTAYAEKLDKTGKPADAVLPKPFSLKELRQAMARRMQSAACTEPAESSSPLRFSRSALQDRAAASSSVLEEILQRETPASGLRDSGTDQ